MDKTVVWHTVKDEWWEKWLERANKVMHVNGDGFSPDEDIGRYLDVDDVAEVIELLHEIRVVASTEGYTHTRFRYGESGWNSSLEFGRLETDEEVAARIQAQAEEVQKAKAIAKKKKLEREERDRKEYERLKKRFDK